MTDTPPGGILDFLSLPLSREEMEVALRVLRAFKACESTTEWFHISFAAWAKLEQLEEFLAHRVEEAPLKADTIAELHKRERKKEGE